MEFVSLHSTSGRRPRTAHFDFVGRTVIVTGAGSGLGREYALYLAARGALVVVNDIGEMDNVRSAQAVVDEITDSGGLAVANFDSVEFGERIVEQALDEFGTVDVLINNAGILRDRSFHKMSLEEWDAVYRVHLLGAYKVTRRCWPVMRSQEYGRVVFTSSASGLHGNFGQANYSMAKMGLVGLARTLDIEGAPKNILCNIVSPSAATAWMLEQWGRHLGEALSPSKVSPLVAFLCHESCATNGALFEIGGGSISQIRWERSRGVDFGEEIPTIENIATSWSDISDFRDSDNPESIADSLSRIFDAAGVELL